MKEIKKDKLAKFLPTLFGFGACFLARGTRKGVWANNEFGDDSKMMNS